ncbi:MAG: glycoside hydrolase family 3 N-terminal domain-containing protein [Muribaculaceae bacterium]|nr:glycoside hydrolase family 3 N-terminal domain-containing protein [Muribaculaceae bacterium]
MKKFTMLALGAAVALSAGASTKPAIARDAAIEKKVEKTLARMTLDEKIGQMTEIAIDLAAHLGPDGQLVEHPGMLDTIIGKYKVGSILNAPGHSLTPKQWNQFIGKIQDISMKELGIPCIYGLDQNHGTTYTSGGTLLPQNINMAATFNPALVRTGAEITAYETRASACPWTYSPTLDLIRNSAWPRCWENFGEDPYLSGVMAESAVRGFQGDDPNNIDKNHIATSIKHYMGYGAPVSGKDRTPAVISEADLREKHFEPYRKAIEAGAQTVMVNSASVNGMPVHADHRLLTEWLKDGLNWDGFIVTDWADINNLFTREKVAADKKEAIVMAINAGIDMTMDPYDLGFCKLLREAVEEGLVPMSRIDDATRRILRVKYRLGLFDNPKQRVEDYPLFASKSFAKDATRAAEESMVLLKNTDSVLPIKKGTRILLTGPNANSMRTLNGGWSVSWQGKLLPGDLEQYNTILEAMQDKFGKANVTYVPGVEYDNDGDYAAEKTPDIDAAVKAAAQADVIVCCIGENSYCETPGNISDITLSHNQQDLVKALAATGKPVVMVINEGRPRVLSAIEPLAKAVVDIMLPGNYGGDALANLLAGDANFSGRLPFTYPRNTNALSTYDYKVSEQVGTMSGAYDYNAAIDVQWPFGFGKSYTTFEYGDLKADRNSFKEGDVLTFSIPVTNTGDREGQETVMLFSSDLVASRCVPDNRRLRAFEKVSLKPGETRTVTLSIPASDLAYVGTDGKWILEKGDFKIQMGDKVTNLTCTETYNWLTANK